MKASTDLPYSQWGIVESWSICPEDEPWCVPDTIADYFAYKRRYEDLGKTFNPVKFDPVKWAKAAKDAGMKYVVFTTKQHDGFCMFDTKYTDYKITSPATPFHSHPRANIAKAIFDAFRAEDFLVGAYFSKPDWHSDDYWWPNFATPDRNVNYDPERHPERWQAFVEFTHNQVMELMTDYGRIDILWLDGGWVKRRSKDEIDRIYAERLRESPSGFVRSRVVNQDPRMDELVAKARAKQQTKTTQPQASDNQPRSADAAQPFTSSAFHVDPPVCDIVTPPDCRVIDVIRPRSEGCCLRSGK